MKKKFLAAVLAGMMVMSMAACGGKATETTKAEETTKTAETTKAAESTKADASKDTGSGDLSGSISMSGSTSMEKLVTALSQDYMEKNVRPEGEKYGTRREGICQSYRKSKENDFVR